MPLKHNPDVYTFGRTELPLAFGGILPLAFIFLSSAAAALAWLVISAQVRGYLSCDYRHPAAMSIGVIAGAGVAALTPLVARSNGVRVVAAAAAFLAFAALAFAGVQMLYTPYCGMQWAW